MINIVCALHCEARPIIEYYKLLPLSDVVFPCFSNKEINLVVSGIGKISTAAAMTYLYVKMHEQKNDAWLNYGIAGKKNSEIGEWFNVNKITESSTNVNWYPARYLEFDCSAAALTTVDTPQFAYEADVLYDMEASAFMATALKFSCVEMIQLMKIVSDNEDNSIECIDKKHVKKIMRDNISPLLEVITLLREKSKNFETVYGFDSVYLDCLEKWHFTQYQRNELQRLVQRWKIFNDNNSIASLKECGDAKQVIQWFKRELDDVAVDFK